VRVRIRVAVAEARVILSQGVKGIPEFEGWTALKQAKDDPSFATARKVASEARAEADTALMCTKAGQVHGGPMLLHMR
jgi:hypothetical protein